MAAGEPTGNADFLQKEVGESFTDEARKAETKRLLEEAEEIKARFPENPAIAKEYEDLRNATILSFQNLQADLKDELLGVRVELDQSGLKSLSNGSIDESEFARIEEEFGELESEEREVQLQKLERVLTEKGMMENQNSLISFLSYPEIPGDLIIKIIDDFQKNGVLSIKTLQELETISRNIMEFNNFDIIKNNRAIQLLQDVLESGDSSPLENLDNYIDQVTRIQALRYIFGEDSTLIGKFLFDFNPKNDFFSDGCSSHAIIFIDYLYVSYLESQNIILEQNLNNYFLNAGISQTRIDKLKPEIEQLKKTLTQGGCNIDYIGSIAEFNNLYFPDKEMILSSKDAKNIISSTIAVREADNTLGFIQLREKLHGLFPNKSENDIQAIFDIADFQERNNRLSELLNTIEDKKTREEIQTEMIGLFENAEDIGRQERTLNDVATDAEMIYEMSDVERAEYRRLLMSLTGSSINIDISREVHRNYILNDPADRLILLENAEDVLTLLPEIEIRGYELDINDINPNFLTHPEILEYFIEQSQFQDQIVGRLPLHIFQNQILAQVIFGGSRFLWKALFQNIYSANTSERAINIILSIVDNNSSQIEEYRDYFKKSIPREIYTEVTGENFETGNSVILSFSDNIELLINPPSEVPVGDTVSPLAGGGIFPEEISPDFAPIGFNQSGAIEEMMLYIRENGLTQEVLNGMMRLRETDSGLNLISKVLPMLHAGNQKHIDFTRQFITPRNTPQENAEIIQQSGSKYYMYLNVALQSHPTVIEEMGRYGIIEFKPIIIKNITSEKLLARYLIGYQASGGSFEDIYENDNFPLLKSFLENTDLEDLSEEEKDVLQSFLGGMGESILEISQAVEKINIEDTEIEELTGQIRDILSEYASESDIEMILELLSINDLDNFFRRLEAVLTSNGIGLEERRGIRNQILDLISQDRQRESESADQVSRDASGLTKQERRELEENPYFENDEFNMELILTNFQSFAQENLEQADLEQMGDREFIIRYLQSLGLPNSVLEKKQEEFIHSIQAQTEEIQANILQELAKNNPEEFERLIELGVGTHAQRKVYERMYSGEINFSSPEIDSSINIQSSTLPENWNPKNPDYRDTVRELSTELRLTSEEVKTLTPLEVFRIANSEKVREGFISFMSTLSELGLSEIWQFRNNVFTAIGSLNINQNNGDYISSEEMSKFLTKVVYATTGNPRLRDTPPDITATKQIIREINHQGTIINNVNAVNSVGESLTQVEFDFREKFAPRNNGVVSFNFTAFQNALRGDFSQE